MAVLDGNKHSSVYAADAAHVIKGDEGEWVFPEKMAPRLEDRTVSKDDVRALAHKGFSPELLAKAKTFMKKLAKAVPPCEARCWGPFLLWCRRGREGGVCKECGQKGLAPPRWKTIRPRFMRFAKLESMSAANWTYLKDKVFGNALH